MFITRMIAVFIISIGLIAGWPGDVSVHCEPFLVEQEGDEPVLLRWKFAKGDVLQIDEHIIETITDPNGVKKVNEKEYRYYWTVEDLSSDGTATLVLKFDRVHFNLQSPKFEFDSRLDKGFSTPAEPTELRAWAFKARTLASVEMRVAVSHGGGVNQIQGAESVEGPMQFTPGDWPMLPEPRVRRGGAWHLDKASAGNGAFVLEGEASYKLDSVKQIDGHRVATIKGKSEWETGDERAKVMPILSTAQFDLSDGRFLDEEITAEASLELAPNRFASTETTTIRKISSKSKMAEVADKSGQNLIIFKAGKPAHVMVAGRELPVEESMKQAVSQLLDIQFFLDWKDADGNKMPSGDELVGVTNRFGVNDKININFSIFGLQDSELRFEILDHQGTQQVSNNVLINGPQAMAIRTIGPLPAGLYFFVFHLDDKHLLRVPIQVVSSMKT